MRFAGRAIIEKEALLLKQCAAGDRKAQERFHNVSYSNEVIRAVQKTLFNYAPELDEDDVAILCPIIIRQIYQQSDVLPSRWTDLRTHIRKYALKKTRDYVRRQLGR